MNTAVVTHKNSTNVRTVPWEIRGLRAGFRLLTPTAPEVAARLAEKLFFTARRFPRPAWEHEVLEQGTAFRVRFRDTPLRAWSFGRSGPAVLLVHGWEGRGAQLGAFITPLVESGLRVVTFDGPAHGDSPGDRASLMDHADAIAQMADEVGPLRGIIAHSMGAPSTLLAMSRRQTADRFVFIAPPIDPMEFARSFSRQFGLDDRIEARMRERIEARYAVRMDELYGPTLAQRVHGDLLVAHDRTDREVPITAGEELVRAWPGARWMPTEGLGHRRILRDPAVIQSAVAFLRHEHRHT